MNICKVVFSENFYLHISSKDKITVFSVYTDDSNDTYLESQLIDIDSYDYDLLSCFLSDLFTMYPLFSMDDESKLYKSNSISVIEDINS